MTRVTVQVLPRPDHKGGTSLPWHERDCFVARLYHNRDDHQLVLVRYRSEYGSHGSGPAVGHLLAYVEDLIGVFDEFDVIEHGRSSVHFVM